ncbi:hypothetical protein [Lamprocystis purpurea]|jgi:hypothetical protein|uniref:hypothetical protein n=1 Tax=Lamprocystis purpurea TaxID=61598 RepID=UPI00037CE018|nr:hypothetical protein [Lamprocystis purpurea]
MSLVVSDTSPLTNLAAIGRLDLLQSLFGRIQIPEAVWFELNAGGRSWPGRNEVADADRSNPCSTICVCVRDFG